VIDFLALYVVASCGILLFPQEVTGND
jgi:hypothetical protein